MEARADFRRMPHMRLTSLQALRSRIVAIGVGCGIAGGLAMAVPVVLYDWSKASHSALELPAAATGWLFGLNYFGQNDYRWGPIIIGAVALVLYFALTGLAFAALADRVYHIRTHAGSLALGVIWSFASFMLFWYMVLPIARDGAPFRPTGAEFVAPTWVWILGFTVLGITTGIAYHRLIHAPTRERARLGRTAPAH